MNEDGSLTNVHEQVPVSYTHLDVYKRQVKLFGEYLRIENILQNYDEFTQLKALQKIDKEDRASLEAFKNANFLTCLLYTSRCV